MDKAEYAQDNKLKSVKENSPIMCSISELNDQLNKLGDIVECLEKKTEPIRSSMASVASDYSVINEEPSPSSDVNRAITIAYKRIDGAIYKLNILINEMEI